jgi:hypothetical protein
MTIAVVLKVGDGLVFGADSATTLSSPHGVTNVYFNAEKIFGLGRNLKAGGVTYGLGELSGRSITSLTKDLKMLMAGNEKPWSTSPTTYTIEEIATKLRGFFYEEQYLKEYAVGSLPAGKYPVMGFFVGGYSANAEHPEMWRIEVDGDGACPPPEVAINTGDVGVQWAGQPEALNRLMNGWSGAVLEGLVKSGTTPEEAIKFLTSLPVTYLSSGGMPIQDAIDLVKYMVDVTAGFVRFAPGPPTVHPPADIATITRHEGFCWVSRKHYFSRELNPGFGAR